MKRALDLVRTILQRVEEAGPSGFAYRELSIDGVDPLALAYHVEILQ